MYRRLLIGAGLGAMAVAGAVLVLLSRETPLGPNAVSMQPSGIVKHMILEGADLVGGAPYTLMLHPLATGDELRVVTDQEVLRAAQPTAFYTDKPGEAMKTPLLSVRFMSPPGNPPDSSFATLIRGKEKVKRFTCYPLYCEGGTGEDEPHIRDLSGLLDASRPVEFVTESFALPQKTRAAHFRALKEDRIVLIEPPNLPPPGWVNYPAQVRLDLPPVLLDTDETGAEPFTPFDAAEYQARFTAAFTHAYPETEAYRLDDIHFTTYYTPHLGWPVVSDAFEGYLLDDQERLRGIDRIMVIEPHLSIDLTPWLAEALLGPDPFERMPEFAREPETLESRLDVLAEEVLGRPCPGCFRIELPVTTADTIKVTRTEPRTYTLSYYRIADDEPSAQQ